MKTAVLLSLLSINSEHQIRLCDDNATILEKLQLGANSGKKSSVYYLETESRSLGALAVSVRLRMKQDKAEITVKKRFGNSSIKLKSEGQTICENDLHGGVSELSCKINATVDKEEGQKILSGKKNWLEVVSKEQLEFLKKYQATLKDVSVYGTLVNKRYQWTDKVLGEVTLDLVEQVGKEEVKYNEISVRYDENDQQTGKRFETFFRNTGIKACDNQLDWPLNKFDTLQILN